MLPVRRARCSGTPATLSTGARAGFGWAALALALTAVVGGALVLTRPKVAAVLLIGGSTLGFIAINLFDINTFYFVALPGQAGRRQAMIVRFRGQ